MEDFNDGVERGVYRLFSEREMTELFSAAGAQMSAYESHEPDFPNHRMCLEKT